MKINAALPNQNDLILSFGKISQPDKPIHPEEGYIHRNHTMAFRGAYADSRSGDTQLKSHQESIQRIAMLDTA